MYNKFEALKYLATAKLEYRNEWIDAEMYQNMCDIILNDKELYSKIELDKLINEIFN